MTSMNVNSRDFRRQVWAQTARPDVEGKLGSVFALSNGHLGLRGSHEEMPSWGRAEFYVAGTYTGGPPSLLGFHDPDHILSDPQRLKQELHKGLGEKSISTLPNLPSPIGVRLAVGGETFSHEKSKILSNERLLETAQALLRRCLVFRDGSGRKTRVDSRRFVSFADRHLICLRYVVTPLNHDATVDAFGFINKNVSNPNNVVLWREESSVSRDGLTALRCVTSDGDIHVAIAQSSVIGRQGKSTVLELFAIAGEMSLDDAVARSQAAGAKGFDACLQEHLAAWKREMDGTAAEFDDDPSVLQGFHFGQMHLNMAFCYGDNRLGVPIKGYTGHGYRFINFWDTDFHMFPYFLMTKPRQAHLLLEYRYNQLDAYRKNAATWGAKGAQVPWETQVSGREETAPWLCLQDREIHISADAAYMFKLYDELTGRHDVMVNMGAEFTFETARFYESRIQWSDQRKRFELPHVGCPDQYHTFADNNVFISRLAKWNLQYALELAGNPAYAAAARKIDLRPEELARWKQILDNFYIIGPNADGIIEEYDGFFNLSGDLDGICETYCAHSQAVKQPDVLATFIPFEDLYPLEVRRKNWKFYAQRTLHGSSLSLPGMAYTAARCGLNDEALFYLHRAVRVDLDDINLDTDRGVHVSSYAVQWYTVAFGFGGLTPARQGLRFAPNLPRQWKSLSFTTHWQFQRLRVALTPGEIRFEADAANTLPVPVQVRDGEPLALAPGQSKTVKTD